MCQTNSWKRLEVQEYAGLIIAARSDGILFYFYPLEFRNSYDFIRKLEEFRNCKCLPNAPCSKHIEESERINADS